MSKPVGLLQNSDGETSSKRFMAITCMVVAIFLAVMKYPTDGVIAFLSASLALQGITAWSERGLK